MCHGLIWRHELPNAIAANQQHVVLGFEFMLAHLWLSTATCIGMAHEIAQATRHIETRIAPVLCVDAMVCIAIEHYTAASLLDARPLILEVWLVISRERNALDAIAVRRVQLAQNYGAVSHMCERKQALRMVKDRYAGRCARHLRTQLLHPVCCGNQTLDLLEAILHHSWHL